MRLIVHWLINAAALFVLPYILSSVQVKDFVTALVVALLLGLANAVIRPVLILLTLPLNILTLGLFTLVINALLIMLAATIVPGFAVRGFWWALLFGIVLAIVNFALSPLLKPSGSKS